MDEKGKYAIEPIKFSSITHQGTIGSDRMSIDYNLTKLLTQNILYAAYREAKKVTDIAYLLDVNSSLVEEIVEYLEDNGFMNKIDNDKYLTNILIHDLSKEVLCEKNKIYKKYANIILDIYIPLLMESITEMDCFVPRNDEISATGMKDNFYVPLNDLNFFKWTIITFALSHKLTIPELSDVFSKFYIKQNDGSEYMTIAALEHDFDLSYHENLYKSSGEVIFSYGNLTYYPFTIWIYNTIYNDKMHDWSIYAESGFMNLYDYFVERFNNYNDKNEIIENLRRKGFIAQNLKSDKEYINMIITKMAKDKLIATLPDMPKNLIAINHELSSAILELCKPEYPQHIQDLCSAFYANSLSNSELLLQMIEILLENGTLKPLTEVQKKTVNMIMFSDRLP